jgi:plastocyanin
MASQMPSKYAFKRDSKKSSGAKARRRTVIMRETVVFSTVLVAACILLGAGPSELKQGRAMSDQKMMKEKGMKEATVIELIQTPGMFEPTELELDPGKYIFKVTNHSVVHEVAFLLSEAKKDGTPGEEVPDSRLPSTLKKGETASTPVVALRPGKYVYQCPLNPTPHYIITVE